ncbi:type II toxin-antitoxin system RelE/ParE family toxin [Aliarcobacter cryaerophilus]|uniref:type II toxin-antitoxin system RelE/ParE family toxin n=1 Tax=Aliarcobacter cryaerophilus TaxID=28198 RepID=UPI003DA2295F
MQIKLSNNFGKNLYIIYEFISKDKLSAAQNFKKELLKTIKALSDFPLKYRKSYYFDDENIRDLTFKGYTIVYEVDFDKKEIFVFHIFNKNLPINIKKENENDSY